MFHRNAKNIDAKISEREIHMQCTKNYGKMSKRRNFKTFSLLTRYYAFIFVIKEKFYNKLFHRFNKFIFYYNIVSCKRYNRYIHTKLIQGVSSARRNISKFVVSETNG